MECMWILYARVMWYIISSWHTNWLWHIQVSVSASPQGTLARVLGTLLCVAKRCDFRIATHCNTLQHTATHYNALNRPSGALACVLGNLLFVAEWCVSCAATHCNTLQPTATHCNTLQHTATHCSTLQRPSTPSGYFSICPWKLAVCGRKVCLSLLHYGTLQHTATHSNTLQHTATHCKTLWVPWHVSLIACWVW